ncbi:MAG: efflux RND transporter permease subunit, partial [Dehalococcoidia bacterium]|nr:efflux RND transporter permease subunit [Dehalococcoidia bacterium]
NGQPAVGLSVVKQSDANSLQVADAVKAQLSRLQPLLPPGAQVVVTNDSSRFTRASLHAVEFDLGLAVILCATVLLLFLHSWRNVLIVCLAIPTSLVSTFIVMYALGIGLNTVTLMALALSIGILVDDSIVVIENINRHLGLGEPPLMAALNGRSEIGLAAIAITLVDIVVYLPIVFMAGNLGQLFREYGIVIAVATLFSLFISFTLTPMLASRLLNTKRPGDRGGWGHGFGRWFDRQWDRVSAAYGWTLRGALRARPLVILLAMAAFGASLMLIPLGYVGTEYVPTDDDNQFTVSVRMPTGTALAATDRVVSQVEDLLRAVPEVDQVFANLQGGNQGSIAVQLKDKRQRARSV